MFAEQAQSKNVALNSFIEGDVPVLLRGDASRLSQVLINLVGNAIKFTPRGETTIRVGRVNETAGETTLRFTVRDTGIGIPLESQRHIFQAFAQADGSTTRKYGGTGLGLAISAQLVELMGGNIGLQSEPGSGSTFWFTATFRKQPAAHQALAIQARLKGVRVLIADHSHRQRPFDRRASGDRGACAAKWWRARPRRWPLCATRAADRRALCRSHHRHATAGDGRSCGRARNQGGTRDCRYPPAWHLLARRAAG